MAYTDIDDPSAYFQAFTYSGTSNTAASYTFTGNSNMKPDLVWLKQRGYSDNHYLFDSSRGAEKAIYSNLTSVETNHNSSLTSFNTNGFSVGVSNVGSGGGTYATWNFKANGGTTASNTDGDITSTVQVNSDAGFSIVTDSPSNNTARSIGHGLGVAPQVVIRRARNRVENWRVFHSAAGSTGALMLDNADAYNSNTVLFTGVTSTTFGVGTDFSVNGNFNYISYCFAEKQGYSKFGKYTGNGNANGPFVYTGFKPAFVMMKRSDGAGDSWAIFDNKRSDSGFNVIDKELAANESSAELDRAAANTDFLSNGFKIRNTDGWHNTSGGTYIYMAFAESPFVTSTGVPTTAR